MRSVTHLRQQQQLRRETLVELFHELRWEEGVFLPSYQQQGLGRRPAQVLYPWQAGLEIGQQGPLLDRVTGDHPAVKPGIEPLRHTLGGHEAEKRCDAVGASRNKNLAEILHTKALLDGEQVNIGLKAASRLARGALGKARGKCGS